MKQFQSLFFGTSEFSVPSFKRVVSSGTFKVKAVVTQQDTPRGRGRMLLPPPVKVAAAQHHIPVLQPPTLKKDAFEGILSKFLPLDIAIVVAYGNIIPKWLRTLPRLETINLHPSLLPRLRGPSPIQTAILNNEKKTGVTVMVIDDELDHGPILAQKAFAVTKRETYTTLSLKLSRIGGDLLLTTLERYVRGEILAREQKGETTYTSLLTKDDGRIDWNSTSETIDARIRGLNPWPGTFTFWKQKRLMILSVEPITLKEKVSPGMVTQLNHELAVGTRNSALKLKLLKLEGGKTLTGEAFLRGHSRIIGEMLSSS